MHNLLWWWADDSHVLDAGKETYGRSIPTENSAWLQEVCTRPKAGIKLYSLRVWSCTSKPSSCQASAFAWHLHHELQSPAVRWLFSHYSGITEKILSAVYWDIRSKLQLLLAQTVDYFFNDILAKWKQYSLLQHSMKLWNPSCSAHCHQELFSKIQRESTVFLVNSFMSPALQLTR